MIKIIKQNWKENNIQYVEEYNINMWQNISILKHSNSCIILSQALSYLFAVLFFEKKKKKRKLIQKKRIHIRIEKE